MCCQLIKNPDKLRILGPPLRVFREFDEVVRDEIDRMGRGETGLEPSYVRRGLYNEQLLRYFNYFERNQILIIDSGLLRNKTATVLNEVTEFLGLQEYDWHQEKLPSQHVRKYASQMADATRAFLQDFYKRHNQKLYQLLGRDFGWQ